MSYSTTFKIDEIQNAAIAFIDQLRPDDRVMVVSFDEDVHMLCEPTNDRKQIYSAIRSTKIATGTSLYEAVELAMNSRLRSIKGRKAIVLFTDGVDTTSRRSNDLENLRDAMELDALIYPIRYDTFADVQSMKNRVPVPLPGGANIPGTGLPGGISIPLPHSKRDPRNDPRNDPNDPTNFPRNDPFPGQTTHPSPTSPGQKGTTAEEYRFAEEYLNQLALRTGGRVSLAQSYGNLNSRFCQDRQRTPRILQHRLLPEGRGHAGNHRRIKVKVNQPDVAVRTRDSYSIAKK